MPKVPESFGISIYLYFREHPPPQFHARYGSEEGLISIRDLSALEGGLSPRARGLVIEWATQHPDERLSAWNRAQNHEPPERLNPYDRPEAMHRIVEVEARKGYRIWIRFEDEVSGEVDLSGLVGKGVFRRWKEEAEFRKVHIDPETGTVAWPGDIDLAPDALYRDLAGVKV